MTIVMYLIADIKNTLADVNVKIESARNKAEGMLYLMVAVNF